jgi:hypothetical protein
LSCSPPAPFSSTTPPSVPALLWAGKTN